MPEAIEYRIRRLMAIFFPILQPPYTTSSLSPVLPLSTAQSRAVLLRSTIASLILGDFLAYLSIEASKRSFPHVRNTCLA